MQSPCCPLCRLRPYRWTRWLACAVSGLPTPGAVLVRVRRKQAPRLRTRWREGVSKDELSGLEGSLVATVNMRKRSKVVPQPGELLPSEGRLARRHGRGSEAPSIELALRAPHVITTMLPSSTHWSPSSLVPGPQPTCVCSSPGYALATLGRSQRMPPTSVSQATADTPPVLHGSPIGRPALSGTRFAIESSLTAKPR